MNESAKPVVPNRILIEHNPSEPLIPFRATLYQDDVPLPYVGHGESSAEAEEAARGKYDRSFGKLDDQWIDF